MKELLASVTNPLERLEENVTSELSCFPADLCSCHLLPQSCESHQGFGQRKSAIRPQGYLVASDKAKQDISGGQVGNSENSAQSVPEKLDWILLCNFLS